MVIELTGSEQEVVTLLRRLAQQKRSSRDNEEGLYCVGLIVLLQWSRTCTVLYVV